MNCSKDIQEEFKVSMTKMLKKHYGDRDKRINKQLKYISRNKAKIID